MAEYHLEVFQTLEILAQSAIAHRGPGFILIPALGIAQPDPARLGKVRCQRHVQQTALPVSPDLRYARERVEVLQNQLEHPWALAFLPDDRGILITLRGGELKLWQRDKGLSSAIPGGKDGSG